MAGDDCFRENLLFFWGHRITPVEMHFANLYSIYVFNLQYPDNSWVLHRKRMAGADGLYPKHMKE
jgi:hypothetical protein